MESGTLLEEGTCDSPSHLHCRTHLASPKHNATADLKKTNTGPNAAAGFSLQWSDNTSSNVEMQMEQTWAALVLRLRLEWISTLSDEASLLSAKELEAKDVKTPNLPEKHRVFRKETPPPFL